MSDSSTNANSGIGFCSLLFLVFLVLKLTGVIAWSWWWVTAPLWGPFVFVILLGLAGILLLGTGEALSANRRGRKATGRRDNYNSVNWPKNFR